VSAVACNTERYHDHEDNSLGRHRWRLTSIFPARFVVVWRRNFDIFMAFLMEICSYLRISLRHSYVSM